MHAAQQARAQAVVKYSSHRKKPENTAGDCTVGTVLKMGEKVNKRRMARNFGGSGRTFVLVALNGKCSGSELRAWTKADRIRAG
jgi:hypothetical protein